LATVTTFLAGTGMDPTRKGLAPLIFDAEGVAVDHVRSLKEPVARVAQHDASLAGHSRRAAASTPLNLREGRRRVGRDRQHRFRIAAGSADEVIACLRVAEAW
jgi:hypothetical protein